MKKIVILGCSPAGIAAIEEIRAKDSSSEITLFGYDGYYPYDQKMFTQLIVKDITFDQVFCKPKNFFTKNKVKVILDKKITRINFKRNKIFTEDKTQIDYDELIMTESPEYKFPDIKGTNKEGVLRAKSLKDVHQLLNNLPFTDTIVIQSNQLFGFQLAMALAKVNKEVIFVSPQQYNLAETLDMETAQSLTEFMKQEKIRVISGQHIEEILGDSDVKAVRLKSGKVLACQMALFDHLKNNLRVLSDAILKVDDKVSVNEQFRANVNNVFALMDVAQGEKDAMDAQEQGRCVGTVITGDALEQTQNLSEIHLVQDNIESPANEAENFSLSKSE